MVSLLKMHCKGVRGRAKTKSVRFPSDNPLTSLNNPFKDNHASSSNDRNSFGPDQRRSSGSGGEKKNLEQLNASSINQ